MTKHTRNSGATTIKRDGKIVGNIGRGKNKVPTVQKMTTTTTEEKTGQTSSLTKASQRFSTLTETVDYSTAQTLWNLTVDKPYSERLNMLGYYIDSLDKNDQNKLLAQIEDEVIAEDESKKWGKKTERMIQFESALANDASISSRYGVPLHVLQHFAEEPSTRWDDVIAVNKDTTLEILTLLAEKKDKSTPLRKANNLMLIVQHDNATPELVTKIYLNGVVRLRPLGRRYTTPQSLHLWYNNSIPQQV